MRWMWIDRIVEHEPAQRLVAVAEVPDEAAWLQPCGEGAPVMPAPLLVEGMAQAAGILVGACSQFQEKVILAKVARADFEREARTGWAIRHEAHLAHLDRAGAATSGTITCRPPGAADDAPWQPLGTVDLMFSHIDRNLAGTEFPEENFVFGENFRALLRDSRLAPTKGSVPFFQMEKGD